MEKEEDLPDAASADAAAALESARVTELLRLRLAQPALSNDAMLAAQAYPQADLLQFLGQQRSQELMMDQSLLGAGILQRQQQQQLLQREQALLGLSGSNPGGLLGNHNVLDSVLQQQLAMDTLRRSSGLGDLGTSDAALVSLLRQQSLHQQQEMDLARLVASQQRLGGISGHGGSLSLSSLFGTQPALGTGVTVNQGLGVASRPTLSQSMPATTFPEKLYKLLLEAEAHNQSHIISFTPSGAAFVIHDEDAFMQQIAPHYFKQTTFGSFRRQLYLYGFAKCSEGPYRGFFHKSFHRGRQDMLKLIRRIKKEPPTK